MASRKRARRDSDISEMSASERLDVMNLETFKPKVNPLNSGNVGYGSAADEQSKSKATDIDITSKQNESNLNRAIIHSYRSLKTTKLLTGPISEDWSYAYQNELVKISDIFNLPGMTASIQVVPFFYWRLKDFSIHFQDIVLSCTDSGTGIQLMQDPIIEFMMFEGAALPATSLVYSELPWREFAGEIIQTTNGGAVSFHFPVNSDWTSFWCAGDASASQGGKTTEAALAVAFQPWNQATNALYGYRNAVIAEDNSNTIYNLSLSKFLISGWDPTSVFFQTLSLGTEKGGHYLGSYLPNTKIYCRVRNKPSVGTYALNFKIHFQANWEAKVRYNFPILNGNSPTPLSTE